MRGTVKDRIREILNQEFINCDQYKTDRVAERIASEIGCYRNSVRHRRLVDRLRASKGQWVLTDHIVDYVYPESHGGPLSARKCIAVFARRLRKIGYKIIGHHNKGYRLEE